jgi:hypothetical protein
VLSTHPAEQLDAATWLVGSMEGLRVAAMAGGLELQFVPAA